VWGGGGDVTNGGLMLFSRVSGFNSSFAPPSTFTLFVTLSLYTLYISMFDYSFFLVREDRHHHSPQKD
jgi:hypothetical protein